MTPRNVRGDNQIALKVFAWRQAFIQNAIEATAAQIPGFAPERMGHAAPGYIHRPQERKPQALASFAFCVGVLGGAPNSDQRIVK